jgi:hypothetical protein
MEKIHIKDEAMAILIDGGVMELYRIIKVESSPSISLTWQVLATDMILALAKNSYI